MLASVASRYDTDGIDIEFLNSTTRGSGMKVRSPLVPLMKLKMTTIIFGIWQDAAAVEALFASVSPKWATPLGTRVEAILNAYLHRFKKDPQHTKPLNLIVITDGAPTDGTATEDAIVRSARELDAHNARTTQLGIQFVQIGNDAGARAYLEMLDNGMVRHGVRDMVDTTPSGAGDGLDLDLVKILIGAVNRRVDNKGSGVLTGRG
ncbi:hypothetical protein H0H81_001815 [Sphagnurus paluster]|uniref:VWFA domain-containing protein n=1 Tax=Sphagnurus paluster TaxID=117069 RepID=A0A9P7GUI0_9AGAR|nr:hypothetical protein H0H81_001815 [Sphagnurus paluster]